MYYDIMHKSHHNDSISCIWGYNFRIWPYFVKIPFCIVGIYHKSSRICQDVVLQSVWEMKWNESGFRPPLCTYRLNWARRTSWGWWDDWDDTFPQRQDSKFEPWRSEAEHATSRSQRLPTILTFTRRWGRNIFCFFQTAETGNRTLNFGVKGSGTNHYPTGPRPSVWDNVVICYVDYVNPK